MEAIKCVIVGDGGVGNIIIDDGTDHLGKTSLATAFTTGSWCAETPSTLFNTYSGEITIRESTKRIQIYDTAGEEDQDRLRPQSYTDADVFLICFSVTSPSSFKNISTKWIREVRKHNPKTPIVLVATKSDLRKDKEVIQRLQERRLEPIKEYQITEKAQEIKATGVVECSALCMNNLHTVFQEAVDACQYKVKKVKKSKKHGQCIMM